MWIEAKATLTVIGVIMIMLGMFIMLFFIPGTELIMLLLFMGVGVIIFGDILILSKTSKWWVKPWFEPCNSSQEIGIVCSIAGGVAAIFTTKRPHGKREFVFHKQEASVINNGDYPLHTPNGNAAFLCHEDHDENINMAEVAYTEELEKTMGTDDIKSVYSIAKKEDETL